MRTLLGVPVLAVVFVALSLSDASAAYLGGASYRHVAGSNPGSYCGAKQQCYTTTKTCKEVVYDQQEYTCYKTVYDTVYDTKTIDCVRQVRETCYRECPITVCKPVYETHYRRR